jgi:hypothetical protein
MGASYGGRRYLVAEQPLSPRDYDVPVGWWGWNWEPPVPMSITEILGAGNMDSRTAAVCGMAIEAHGSLLIAAEEPHSGKTTTLTALLDYLPSRIRRIFVRGWAETFDFVQQTKPDGTILLANELSSHLPVYLWGPKAVRTFSMLERGYALGSTLHADSADEAVAQLTQELGVDPRDLARVELLMVMRLYATARGHARRVVSLHRLGERDGEIALTPLVTHDVERDDFAHEHEAELALLAELRHEDASASSAALEQRAARLDDLVRRGMFDIPEVRTAIGGDRGERALLTLRGDPVNG